MDRAFCDSPIHRRLGGTCMDRVLLPRGGKDVHAHSTNIVDAWKSREGGHKDHAVSRTVKHLDRTS